MMYPRGEYRHTPCRQCKGTGKVEFSTPLRFYDCDACNGTGIEGSPGCLAIIFLLMVSFSIAGLLLWLR